MTGSRGRVRARFASQREGEKEEEGEGTRGGEERGQVTRGRRVRSGNGWLGREDSNLHRLH